MKRIISLVLVFALLLTSASMLFTSCGEEETKKPDITVNDPVKDPIEEGDIFAERAAVPDDLGEYDFGGRELRVVSHKPEQFYIEEDLRNKGDLMADAKFNANATAENRFNFKIGIAYSGVYTDVNNYTSKTILSGADEFDLFCSHSCYSGSVVVKNVFLNWYDIPNVDFSKPWWNSACTGDLTYDGKCILAVSDFISYVYMSGFCIYFNKALAASYDMGNLYQVVLDGKWTIDYLQNLVKDIYIDSDGSGDRSVGDTYGFAQPNNYYTSVSSWMYAFDNPPTAKDEEGVPQITVKTDKINSIVNKMYDFLFNTPGVYYEAEKVTSGVGADQFFAKKAVLYHGVLSAVLGEKTRNFEDDYGILPLPKWNEEQKEYKSYVSGEHQVLAVPKTCKDTEFVGTCVEALSAEYYRLVVPTFYEIALKTRYLRDSESKIVLDYIKDGISVNFANCYGNGQCFGGILGEMMVTKNNNFESLYQSKLKAAQNQIKNVIKAFDKLD